MPSYLCAILLLLYFFSTGHLCFFDCTLCCSTVFLFECFTNNVWLIDAAPQRAPLIKYDSARRLRWTLLLPTNLPHEGSSKGSLLSLKSFLSLPPQCVVFPPFRKTKQKTKKNLVTKKNNDKKPPVLLTEPCQPTRPLLVNRLSAFHHRLSRNLKCHQQRQRSAILVLPLQCTIESWRKQAARGSTGTHDVTLWNLVCCSFLFCNCVGSWILCSVGPQSRQDLK